MDVASLAAFRILFGTTLLVEVGRFVHHGWIGQHFLAPRFLFTYHGLEWLAPLLALGMYLLFVALGILSTMILLGYKYRLAMTLFWIGFSYVALLDKAHYLNHFYFVSFIALLMIFMPAAGIWSLDVRFNPALRQETMPAWMLWLLRFQIAVPYLYGGLAKLNGDWLHGQPMQTWMWFMPLKERFPAFGEHWLALVFSYGGLAFDLGIVPLLLWRRTRMLAFIAAVGFHVTNHFLFHIGIFPWLMIAATTLFFEPDWPRRVLAWWKGSTVRKRNRAVGSALRGVPSAAMERDLAVPERHGGRCLQPVVVALVAFYVLVQLLVPFRHFLYPGNVDWTEEGTHFSWRMMLNEKPAVVQFVAEDPQSGKKFGVDPRVYLTPHQIQRMARDPEMLREFAAFLKRDLASQGIPNAKVRVLALVSLNGRKPQLLVDPHVDLGSQPRSYIHQPWIMPLVEPRRLPPWNVPPKDWAQHVEIPQ